MIGIGMPIAQSKTERMKFPALTRSVKGLGARKFHIRLIFVRKHQNRPRLSAPEGATQRNTNVGLDVIAAHSADHVFRACRHAHLIDDQHLPVVVHGP